MNVSTEIQNSLPYHSRDPRDRQQTHTLLALYEDQDSSRRPSPPRSLSRGRGLTVLSQTAAHQNVSRQVSITNPPTSSFAHRRSTSLSGMNQGVGNLNRWSKSTASSAASTHSANQRSPSIRRMSLSASGSTTFFLGADSTSPEKKKPYRNQSSAAYPSSTYQDFENTLTLPPIVTIPSSQTASETYSPSTAGLISAAARDTVPDYFGKAWEDSQPRAFAAAADPTTGVQSQNSRLSEDERRRSKGHSRHRSQAAKSSVSTDGSNRNSRGPSQKAMLSKALQKANTAVLLDNAQNFEGAMQAYSEACTLLQQVMARSSGDEDRRKLEAIRNTYTSRINELRRLTPYLQDDGKALPQRPESGDYRRGDFQAPDDDEEPAIIETATATRITNEASYITDSQQARSIAMAQLPVRRESLMPSALGNSHYGGRLRIDHSIERSQSKSPMRERVREMSISLPPHMDSIYAPPPLSPRRPRSPMAHGSPKTGRARQQTSEMYNVTNFGVTPAKGHTRAPSNESMSWLDTIDESGGSAASSVHSRTSSMGVRRKRIRAASGATEAEFDAALDAAVEAAYDDGLEPVSDQGQDPYDEDDDDDAIVANVRRKVELAKERVRQSERESAIQNAREQERRRLLNMEHESQSRLDDYDNESEEEERMLEEMTREYVMDDFEFGLQSKSALPRESDSSGLSGRTSGWNSSIGSNPNTAGTILSTVTEASGMPQIPIAPTKSVPLPPPSQALPPPPPAYASGPKSSLAPATQGVRSRRLSGQNPKQLKIETQSSQPDISQPPSMPPPRIPDSPVTMQPKTAGFLQQRQPLSSRPPLTQANRLATSPFPNSMGSDILSPPSPSVPQAISDETDLNGPPRSGSPARAHSRSGLSKNFSSSSLKNMKSRNLSVSNFEDDLNISPHTPSSSQFASREGRLPALPTLPTPIATAFKDKLNPPTGGLYLFDSDIHSPESPGSLDPLNTGAPIPLEPCPTEFLLRPFWLMRALYQTIAHPRGGYLSTKLFVPRDVWRVKGVKIKSVEDKITNCDFLTAALLKLARVDTYDADAVLEEMQILEGILEQVQATLTKKLGSDVGIQNSSGIFKDTVGADAEGSNTSKPPSTSSKSSSFSWRRLRSKNSGVALSSAYLNKASSPPDLPKESPVTSTLPMTTTSIAKVRFPKRDVSEVQFSGPNANYMGALARLFDAAQAIDQIARQVEDPGLRHADKTQVGLELCTRHAAEFFGFYICRFVLADIALLLDKFIKRGSEWVLV